MLYNGGVYFSTIGFLMNAVNSVSAIRMAREGVVSCVPEWGHLILRLKNPQVKQSIESGSEFSIKFSRSPNMEHRNKHYQVVARVSDEVRKAIKANKDRLFVGMSSYRVVDRFYIKRCNKCRQYGHYE